MDSREFKNIIPNLKRKAVGDVDAEDVVVEAIAVDPKFSKLDAGEELLTTKEIRDLGDAAGPTDLNLGLGIKVEDGTLNINRLSCRKSYRKKVWRRRCIRLLCLVRRKKDWDSRVISIPPQRHKKYMSALLKMACL